MARSEALNGELKEVNFYVGASLFKKVYPRLLETYAIDASLSREADQPPAALWRNRDRRVTPT